MEEGRAVVFQEEALSTEDLYVNIHEKEEKHTIFFENCHENGAPAEVLASSEGRDRENSVESGYNPNHPEVTGWFAEHSPLWPGRVHRFVLLADHEFMGKCLLNMFLMKSTHSFNSLNIINSTFPIKFFMI